MRRSNNLLLNSEEINIHYIHVSCLSTPEIIKHLTNLLNAYEKQKLNRFHRKVDRNTYLLSRVSLRKHILRYLGSPKQLDLKFKTNRYGKPYLDDEFIEKKLYFNISHSGGYVVCAFSRFNNLGIDVECVKSEIDIDNLASNYFAKEEVNRLIKIPTCQRLDRFYQYWTMKEAFIKAIGMGLSMPLDHFYIDILDREKAKVIVNKKYDFSSQEWLIRQINIFPKCKMAVCFAGENISNDELKINLIEDKIEA